MSMDLDLDYDELAAIAITDLKVAICTPTSGSVKATYAASLLGMVLHYLQNPVNTDVPFSKAAATIVETREVIFDMAIGSIIGNAREHMVSSALKDPKVTHVLFIDDDMGFEPDCLNLALQSRKPIVIANYRRKAPPWSFTARKLTADGQSSEELVTDSNKFGMEEALFGGFGFALIQRCVFEAVPQPRFIQQWVEEQKRFTTEDLPFYKMAREAGFPAYVDHTLSQRVRHVGDYAYSWEAPPEQVKVMRSIP